VIQQQTKHACVHLITGPTGTGKSALAERWALEDGVIINADTRQLCQPLTIGTAKPHYTQSPIPHRLFDTMTEPVKTTSIAYGKACRQEIEQAWSVGKVPYVVGGSGFYCLAIFQEGEDVNSWQNKPAIPPEKITWDTLYAIDQARAQAIHPHDHYRIACALSLWQNTGKLPSTLTPRIWLPEHLVITYVDRPDTELQPRLAQRIRQMLAEGWIEEVAGLSENWLAFARESGVIGYEEVAEHIAGRLGREEAAQAIYAKTWQYVRKQRLWWRRMKRILQEYVARSAGKCILEIRELSLTLSSEALYIDRNSQAFACVCDNERTKE
jgi:tRNA dimethylallyltransferase